MNSRKITIVILVVIVLVGGFFWFNDYIYQQKQGPIVEYKNAIYTVDGKLVQLVNGRAETDAAPGSASKIITTYFGNEAKGDLNGDGVADLAFLLTQTTGGSGAFYYVAVALQDPRGSYSGTNAILLGDRIAPQTTEIRNGEVIVNYAERKAGEPMTARPSVGVSKYLKISGSDLVEVSE